LACQQGDLKAVQLWKNNHSQEQLPLDDNFGKFPIHYAAENGHAEVVDYLATWFGYDVNEKTVPTLLTKIPEQKTAMHFAAEKNHINVFRVLLKHGGNAFETDQNGKSPLDIAKEDGNKGYPLLIKVIQKHYSQKGQ
jgi:ankyrin repeat protein